MLKADTITKTTTASTELPGECVEDALGCANPLFKMQRTDLVLAHKIGPRTQPLTRKERVRSLKSQRSRHVYASLAVKRIDSGFAQIVRGILDCGPNLSAIAMTKLTNEQGR